MVRELQAGHFAYSCECRDWERQGPAEVLQAAGKKSRQERGQAPWGLRLGNTEGVHFRQAPRRGGRKGSWQHCSPLSSGQGRRARAAAARLLGCLATATRDVEGQRGVDFQLWQGQGKLRSATSIRWTLLRREVRRRVADAKRMLLHRNWALHR